MALTPEREAELMENAMPNIYKACDNFAAKCKQNSPIFSYDDMVQAVSIAYLVYIRKCETEEELAIFPWFDAKHAICELVLGGQPLSVPHSTKTFNEVIHSLPQTVPFDLVMTQGLEIDGMSRTWVPDKETEIDFNTFMESQDELNNRLVAMRLRGTPIRAIAEHCEIKKSAIGARINNMLDEYKKFLEEDDVDE